MRFPDSRESIRCLTKTPPPSVVNNKDDVIADHCNKRKREIDDREIPTSPKKKPIVSPKIKSSLSYHGYFSERQGERKEMQDRHNIIDDFHTIDNSRISYYAIFDGHGGDRASSFVCENLHKNILSLLPKKINKIDVELKKAIVDSFKKTDKEFLSKAKKGKPVWKDGSTAVIVLSVDNTLYIFNLGDSKAILCRTDVSTKKSMSIPLTVDHNPTLYDERKRIQKCGGKVTDGRVMGILEVSRAFGDGGLKQYGVSCIPDMKRCQLTSNDRYLLMACDGLWKSFDNRTAIEYVDQILNEYKNTETDAERKQMFDHACSRLAGEAVKRLSGDNVTVLIVDIRPLTREQIVHISMCTSGE